MSNFNKQPFSTLPRPAAVLFDLDGTLVDTADDLGAALNAVMVQHGRPTVAASDYRPVASHGARGLLQLGFGKDFSSCDFTSARNALLEHYEQHIAEFSRPFAHVMPLLTALEQRQIPWAVVTNKPWRLAAKLMRALPELTRCQFMLGGDSLSVRKPDPAPLWLTCHQLRVPANQCWYIGDAERDIEAANRAGMVSILANYGYLAESDEPHLWQADYAIDSLEQLIPYL